MNKIIHFGLFVCLFTMTSCVTITRPPSTTESKSREDSIRVTEKLKAVSENTELIKTQAENIKLKVVEVENTLKECTGEPVSNISKNVSAINTSNDVILDLTNSVNTTLKNTQVPLTNIENRGKTKFNWDIITKYLPAIIIVIIIFYLGLAPVIFTVLKKIIKAIIAFILHVIEEIKEEIKD